MRGNQLIIDPVLLGSEGLQYQTPNNAGGLPEAPDQVGANIRLALAIEGPLRVPGIKTNADDLVGTNNAALRSVIRDFRSGNRKDDSADISRGFVRDPIPPRIVGQILMYLEKVEPLDDFTQLVTVFKNEVVHEIDRGDVLRLFVDNRPGTGGRDRSRGRPARRQRAARRQARPRRRAPRAWTGGHRSEQPT